MVRKSEIRREALRLALIEAAEERIKRDGAGAIKARELAKDVGCATGAIYNVFEDLNALVMAVNGRTFLAMGRDIAESRHLAGGQSPQRVLIAMSQTYLDFAAAHTNLWRALFDLHMTVAEVPDWYQAELDKLFANISETLADLWPTRGAEEIALMTRALFSSVHGIVLLGLEQRISGVPKEMIALMIEKTLTELTGSAN
ncbi:transcriptional regulator, TetR family [Aliiroseovarius halocynthiae]|uniref:TetR/AcrR family transcriptional regulator n=1 Tax=Aliiroseovarius halocynthiae TaxID=985055 RepID=A0A545SR83_9RHOB|nr:TetR/AcrR family transcriptional regulator [Aliiroseovarius halocynthiae]TQV67467.1 TetR/AcrR family transcriptional regulator [Aliiroseovarius halocynthiae]SMR81475.1 transcriptional regulator, TetR family [Aliiroseovarius halocynthiae]